MSVRQQNFNPQINLTLGTGSGTSVSQTFTQPYSNSAQGGGGNPLQAVRFVNASGGTAFYKVGKGSQTATATDIPVLANSERTMDFPAGFDTIACLQTSTGFTYANVGEGS